MEHVRNHLKSKVKELFGIDVEVQLTRPEPQFGDFTSNVAMQLAGQMGKSPRVIAEALALNISDDSITNVEVAGPGFINLTLSDQLLLEMAQASPDRPYHDRTVVIETNNPNPFKAMHIGHAFNAIAADTIANLIDQGGAHTIRVSYHGDVGLHVGKSMHSLIRFTNGDVSKLEAVPESERNSFMSRMYAEGSAAYKENSKAKAEIDELTQMSFTREDPLYAALYDTIFKWSFEQITANVARLGNKPTEKRFLESDAELRGVKIVRDNTPAVFKESDGALVFEGSRYGSFDNAFVSKRGTGLYAARDLGLIQLKYEQFHPDKSYIITAEEQRAYFVGVLAAADLCMPGQKGVTVNIPTGTVKLTTGKMSSREGDVVEIDWLFDQVAEAIKARGGTPDDQLIAGALRYEFLRVRIGGDVVFDIQEAVSIHGNSGPYLQYAHARARSVLRKAGNEGAWLAGQNLEADERTLVRKIGGYSEAVNLATEELLPHHIATYLYELAQTFNRFYENNRVVGDEREKLRLALVNTYANTLKSGLELLGIHAPEHM